MLLGLFKVMVRVETPPALMVAGLKALLSVGASARGDVDGQGRDGRGGVAAVVGLQRAGGSLLM